MKVAMSYLPCPGHILQHDLGGRYGRLHVGSGHSFLTFTHTTRPSSSTFPCVTTCNWRS